jgi:hypothetical protein
MRNGSTCTGICRVDSAGSSLPTRNQDTPRGSAGEAHFSGALLPLSRSKRGGWNWRLAAHVRFLRRPVLLPSIHIGQVWRMVKFQHKAATVGRVIESGTALRAVTNGSENRATLTADCAEVDDGDAYRCWPRDAVPGLC